MPHGVHTILLWPMPKTSTPQQGWADSFLSPARSLGKGAAPRPCKVWTDMWVKRAFMSHFCQRGPTHAQRQHPQATIAGDEVLPPRAPSSGYNSCRAGLSVGPADIWLGGSAPATGHWYSWWREGGGGWTAMKKKYPKFCKVLLMKATVLAFLPCAKDLAEPTRLRSLHSKLEEFGTVQGSPPYFASIPQQCLCLLNILQV